MKHAPLHVGPLVVNSAFAAAVSFSSVWFMWAPTTTAAEWERGASMRLGGYLTDNVCLGPFDEQSRWIATARPGVSVQGTGARSNLALDAAVEYNSLGDSNVECEFGQAFGIQNREAWVPRINLNADHELIADWLVIDVFGSAGRNAIDPFAPGGQDGLDARRNDNLTYNYGAGATTERRLGERADFRLRYQYDEQYNSIQLFGDSQSHRAEFDVGTRPEDARFAAGVSGSYQEVTVERNDIDEGFDIDLATLQVNGSMRLSDAWSLEAAAGQEWNDFLSIGEDIDGTFWDVGVRWAPNSRIVVSAGTGERFFGSTPRAAVEYRHKRSQLELSYGRSVQFPRDFRGGGGIGFRPQSAFEPDFGELPGDPISNRGQATFVGNQLLLTEQFSVRYTFTGQRITASLSASDSRQTRFIDGAEGEFRSVAVTVSRELARNLSLNARAEYGQREGSFGGFGGPGGEQENILASVGLSYRVLDNVTFSTGYQYRDQDTDFLPFKFTENRLTFTLDFEL